MLNMTIYRSFIRCNVSLLIVCVIYTYTRAKLIRVKEKRKLILNI